MENSSDMIMYALVGILLWSLLLYYIISTAVKSASRNSASNLKIIMRLKAKQMRKQGFTYQDIYDCLMSSDEDFWKKLSEEE